MNLLSLLNCDESFELIFLNGPTPFSFFVYFQSFQTYINTIFTTNQCEKCPSSIQYWDSNPRPLEHESSPITTRPGLLFKLDSNFEYDALLLCKCRPKYQKKIKSFLEKYFSTDVTGNKLPQLIHFFLVS